MWCWCKRGGGAGRGLGRLSPVGLATWFLLLASSVFDLAKLGDAVTTGAISFRAGERGAPSDHQGFKHPKKSPAAANRQLESSRELVGVVFSLGCNGFCLHERRHFFRRAAHFFN